MHWVFLALGISIEIPAATSRELSDGFTKIGYASLTLMCFGLVFHVMSLFVRTMPLAIAYSVWAGGGIAGVAFIGAVAFRQTLDLFAYLGVGLIIAGAIVLNALPPAASG